MATSRWVPKWLLTGWRIKSLVLILIYCGSAYLLPWITPPKPRFTISTSPPQSFKGFSPDESLLITSEWAGPVLVNAKSTVWDIQTGKPVGSLPAIGRDKVVFSNDSRFLVVDRHDASKVEIYQLPECVKLATADYQLSSGPFLAFLPDGRLIIGENEMNERLWDWRREPMARLDFPADKLVCYIPPPTDGCDYAIVLHHRDWNSRPTIDVELWNWRTGRSADTIGKWQVKEALSIPFSGQWYFKTAFSPKGDWLAISAQIAFRPVMPVNSSRMELEQFASIIWVCNIAKRTLMAVDEFRKADKLEACERLVAVFGGSLIEIDPATANLLSTAKLPEGMFRWPGALRKGADFRWYQVTWIRNFKWMDEDSNFKMLRDKLIDWKILEDFTDTAEVRNREGQLIAQMDWPQRTFSEEGFSSKLSYFALKDNATSSIMIFDVPWPTDWQRVLLLAFVPCIIAVVAHRLTRWFFRRSGVHSRSNAAA